MEKIINVGGRLHNPVVGGALTGANEIKDDTKGKMQNVINQETDAELVRLDEAKQEKLTFDQTPTEGSTNPVTSGGVYAADAALQQTIEAILLLIPSAASALNQLADKSFVNSSISTATATFRGTYNLVTDLELTVSATHQQIAAALASVVSTADNNDYCFVQIPVSDQSTDIRVTERYKFDGISWEYEYDLNNSGFTADQWAAINSGITSVLVSKLGALPTDAELAVMFNGKQNTLTFDSTPVAGSDNPVKSSGLYNAFAVINAMIPEGADANNKLVAENRLVAYVTALINALDATFDVTSADGHVTLRMTQSDGLITSVQVLTSDIASASALTTLGGRVSTAESDIDALQDAYAALTQSDVVIVNGALPSSGQQQNIIYRQPDQDHTPPQFYSDYMWNGTTWVLMATYMNAIDARPKKGSQSLVTSGGVFDNMGALDVSELNATENPHTLATYADLSAALAAIPSDYQKGGMSIKFVQTSDNNYVQYFCKSTSFTTNTDDWEKLNLKTDLYELGKYIVGYNLPKEVIYNIYYTNNNGEIKVNSSEAFRGLKLRVNQGDLFYLKAAFNEGLSCYFIADESNNILYSSSLTLWQDGMVEISQDGAYWLYVNIGWEYLSQSLLIKCSIPDNYDYQKIIKLFGQFGHNLRNEVTYNIYYTNNNGAIKVNSSEAFRGLKLKVGQGEKYYLKTSFHDALPTYFIADSSDNILYTGTTALHVDEVVNISQANAKWLYININWESLSSSILIDYTILLDMLFSLKESVGEIISEKENVRNLFPVCYYPNLLKTKCPNFYQHMKKKDKDVCVVLTGTSLVQGNRYTSQRADAAERPPLLFANDLASALFDKMIKAWPGQKYRMYNHTDITYSSGSWEVTNDLVVNDAHIWDDRLQFKNPWTKTTVDANAYVRFTIPADAWQFNFIYKTDTTGGTCTVGIAEGNGKVEVWNGSAWVEANGYTFSMHEDEPQYSHDSGLNTRGNTTYQKRLKMRCKNNISGGINSIGQTKVLTISKGNDSSRLNVVGFEWSPREFMFTLINGARGSHQWAMDYSYLPDGDKDVTNLEAYQDNDIWAFNPDLIITEVTMINWEASYYRPSQYHKRQFEYYARKAFFNEAVAISASGVETPNPDDRSLYAKSNGYENCEIIFFGSLMAGHAENMYDANGNFVFVQTDEGGASQIQNNIVGDSNGDKKTAVDNYDWVDEYMKSKTDYIYIPTLPIFIDIAFKHYGSYYAAFNESGANGATFSYDTTHLNDNGAALWASLIVPLFDEF